MNVSAGCGVTRTSGLRAVTIAVDRACGRVYDSSYPVTAHAPRGRASHLRSPASTWTRANLAAAWELRLHAVMDPRTIHAQGRPRVHEDPFGPAHASLRRLCRSGPHQRSRPADRAHVKRLRAAAPSPWRTRDGAGPAACPERGQPGIRAAAAARGVAHRTRFDTTSVPRRYARRVARSNRPRSFAKTVGRIDHRLGARFSPTPQRILRGLQLHREAGDGCVATAH